MTGKQCYYCGNTGQLVRFLEDGIKYKCNTVECNEKIAQRKLQECYEIRTKQQEERKKKQQEQREKWGDYIYEHHEYFISAELQYRDACTRLIDPFKGIIFKRSFITNDWSEWNAKLTHRDLINLRKHRKELMEIPDKNFKFTEIKELEELESETESDWECDPIDEDENKDENKTNKNTTKNVLV